MSTFKTTLEQRVQQILPDLLEREKEVRINTKSFVYSGLSEVDLSAYQVAFLELFFENRDELFKDINKELDAFFLNHEESKGATFEGLILPSDNSSEWSYRIGLMNGSDTRSFLNFHFMEWTFVNHDYICEPA
ncbi:MAG: hypothetical protein IPP86_17850 [Bacteroidetes bacterium]|nr:hypothetical protein [Bacteroidota bacterium]